MKFQVIPEYLDAVCLVQLNLRIERTTLERWEPYRVVAERRFRTIPFRQPVFGAETFEMVVTMMDGDTVLLGSSTTADGRWVHAVFLTARREPLDGERKDRN